ncbi:cytochrome c [Pseudomonas aeruginosa]|uniref:cytochrome c n=1 Tax=Pseudomonas aeruginosa TaxID=287 RepID=UPI000EB2D466|nr:cytochrome c [Pseudomonas aeruginosa]NNB83816.1 cytochrome c [Pseudomonas aeruginosa]
MLISVKGRTALLVLAGCLTVASLAWAGDESGGTKTTGTVQPLARPEAVFGKNCQGCHGSMGSKGQEIPTLANQIGYFARAPEGRAFLVQVPNVALATINDADLAAMLNWMLTSFSADQLPADFKPYSAAEVAELRKVRINPASRRTEVVKILEARRLVPNSETMSLASPDAY